MYFVHSWKPASARHDNGRHCRGGTALSFMELAWVKLSLVVLRGKLPGERRPRDCAPHAGTPCRPSFFCSLCQRGYYLHSICGSCLIYDTQRLDVVLVTSGKLDRRENYTSGTIFQNKITLTKRIGILNPTPECAHYSCYSTEEKGKKNRNII